MDRRPSAGPDTSYTGPIGGVYLLICWDLGPIMGIWSYPGKLGYVRTHAEINRYPHPLPPRPCRMYRTRISN